LTRYKYLYSPDQHFSGNLFFRIKETNTAARIDYSEVRTVALNGKGAQYSLYPNPSITGITIQFNNPAGGNYEVNLINAYGQLNFKKKYSLDQGGSIKIEWPEKPAAGIYFLMVKDLTHQTQQIERLKIL
ncbi:MAG TPA: T9SS type A sorting domain-containing protein, partial [Chitinophagaceae bacterium]|nr:T9SS type A sorting domain-containing protein [Chitinophagaceae bacterium]